MQHPSTTGAENPVNTTNHDFSNVGVTFLGHSMEQRSSASQVAATSLVSAYSMSPMMSATGAPRMSFAGNMVHVNTSAAGMRLPQSMPPGGLHGMPVPPGPRTPDGQPMLSPMNHSPFPGFPYAPVMTALESPTSLLQARLQHSPGFPFSQHAAMHPQQVFFPGPFEIQANGTRPPPIDKMSWLDAAEIILQESHQPLPLKEIKLRIVEQGLVGPNARSSLETLMHRDTLKGSKRFKKLDDEMAVFRLMTQEERKAARKANKKSNTAASSATKSTTAKTPATTKASAAAKSAATASTTSSGTAVSTAAATQAEKSEKFRRKSQNLRHLIKAMVFENAALCDEVSRTEAKLPRARAERRFLLLRLLHYQALTGQSILDSDLQTAKKEAEKKEKEAEKKKEKSEKLTKKEKVKERERKKSRHKHKKNKKAAKEAEKKVEVNAVKKKKPSSSLKRHILPIPMDDSGKPVFPIVLGSLTVYNLGEVLHEKPTFYSDRYIYPAGFHSTRVYGSMEDPMKRCTYTCKIINCDNEAQYEIIDPSDPPVVLSATSAARCHKKLLQAINKAFGEDVVNESRDRAMEFFGFSHPTIQNLIQGLPEANKCSSYRWLRFEECKPEEREKIAHWYESDPTVCFQALVKAYRKRIDEKQSEASATTTSSTTTTTSTSTPLSTTSALTSQSESHNLRSLLTSAPIVTPQQATLNVKESGS